MAISKPDGFPTYAVVEDSPERLVLETRGAIYFPAAILLLFALFLAAAYAEAAQPWLLAASGIFFAIAVFVLLRWRRFVFDAKARNVAFDSILFGRWKAALGAIDGITTASDRWETREKVGDVEQTRYYTVYQAFLVVNGTKILLNENKSSEFIRDLCSRVEALRAG